MIRLSHYLYNGMAGDPPELLIVLDQPALGESPRKVSCLFDTYVGGVMLSDPAEVVL